MLRSRSDFDGLERAWSQLHAEHDGPMREHAWFASAMTAFEVDPFVLVVGSLDSPAAVAPLGLRRRRLETVGWQLWEPNDFLYADVDALAELVARLVETGWPLALSRLLHASPAFALVERAYADAVVRAQTSAAPVIRLDETWQEPERHLNAGRRSDLRRARRRAGDGLSFELHEPAEDEVAPLLAEAFAVEDRSWKRTRGSSLARNAKLGRFFQLYGRAAAAAGTLRVAFARIDGQAVAMQLAVERGGALWVLKIGYDEDHGRCSPGQLLLVETLRDAAARGLSAYELLGGVEAWTNVWTSETRPCSSLRIYPRRASALPALVGDGVELLRRRLRR